MYNANSKEYRYILQSVPRLRRLHVDFDRPDRLLVEIQSPLPIVKAILVSPMLLLETAVFYRPEACLIPFLAGKKLFSNQAPRLREPVVAHEMIHLKLSVFSKIPALILLQIRLRDSKTLKLFLEGITCMRYLERFELKDCTLGVPKVEKRCLHINGHLLGYAKFIGHLSVPQRKQ
ncbi:hypothetical protein NLJ89_g7072 [Agrocybe chaxingu]|uniref:Uncharacterized protein n=1 Tax=Agrocybe chaxingu TaxID=84603 RepID=A0A9W8JY17_9AGAR|nr:hypothetical protein NLJ89_g7072 [Agrocybe chaxingu]